MSGKLWDPLTLTDSAREKIARFMADDPRKNALGVVGHAKLKNDGEVRFIR